MATGGLMLPLPRHDQGERFGGSGAPRQVRPAPRRVTRGREHSGPFPGKAAPWTAPGRRCSRGLPPAGGARAPQARRHSRSLFPSAPGSQLGVTRTRLPYRAPKLHAVYTFPRATASLFTGCKLRNFYVNY